jgi:hypothetical protein
MRNKKIYIIVIPSLNLSFTVYNINQLMRLKKEIEHEGLKYYIKEKIYQ